MKVDVGVLLPVKVGVAVVTVKVGVEVRRGVTTDMVLVAVKVAVLTGRVPVGVKVEVSAGGGGDEGDEGLEDLLQAWTSAKPKRITENNLRPLEIMASPGVP